MSEKLLIEIEGSGAEQLKKQLTDIGREGTRVAQELRTEFRKGLEAGGSSTNLGREARIAMNSFKQAERERAAAARAASKEIEAARRAEANTLKQAEKIAAAARRTMVQDARAQARTEIAAAREAARAIIAAKQAQAAADRRFVAEEKNRSTGLRRAQVREAREAAAEEAKARRDAASAKKGAGTGAQLLMGAVAVISVRELAGGFVELSDSMENARNRMRNVSSTEGEMNTTMQVLKKTALDNRTEFDLTTRTYARMKNATSELHVSTAANVEMTNTLTKAIAVSGATGEEAHATLIQLSQAMASNRLSADEFRSVAEQLPIILDLLAASTGKSRTQLKKMGEDGQLTTAVVTLAILNGQKKIADMFAKTNPTIAQSWTNVGTEARFAIDQFNKATGASKTVVEALQWMSHNMDTLTFAAKTLGLMIGGYLVAQIGSAAIALRALALANPWTAAILGFTAAISVVREYRNEILNTLGIEHEWEIGRGLVKRNSVTVQEKDPVTGQWVTKEKDFDRDKADRYRHNIEEGQRQLHEEAQADARKQLMDRLRKQQEQDLKNHKNGRGRGRRPPTFADAVNDLEQEVGEGTLTNRARSQMEAIMKVQDKLNGSLREGDKDYKHLNESQQEYVVTLLDSKKKQQDTIATQQALFKLEMDRLDALQTFRKEWKLFVAEYAQDQLRLQRDIKIGVKKKPLFPKLSTDLDFSRATEQVNQGEKSGYFTPSEVASARRQIEYQRPNITEPRKKFIEELEGMGKFQQSIDAIFGEDGSIATGFSSAIAHSITFHDSFKKSIHDLGKSIQQEILQTLIQGLVRMAILGAMGGTKVTSIIPTGLPPSVGGSKAVGGYTGDGPRTGIAGYNHYGEFVVNRQGTQQNRAMLETINKGGTASGGGGMQVTVINQHSGVQHEVQQVSPNEIYIIARQAVKDHAGKAVAAAMSDANNPFMKRLGASTNARVQR